MTEIRVNLGCGLNAVDAWDNLDRSPNLLLARAPLVKKSLRRLGVLSDAHMVAWPLNVTRFDIRRRLPYADGSVSAVYSSHALEHVFLEEAQSIIHECARILCPGGILRLAMPDGERLARDLLDGVATEYGDPGLEFNRHLCAHPFARPSMKGRVLSWFASGPHRWQPTTSLLHHFVGDAGFVEVEEKGFRVGSLPDLELIEHREQSIFVEAVRPDS